MKIRFFAFFCFANSLLACEPDNRAFAESTLRTMERYHGIPVNELAVNDLPDTVMGHTFGQFPPYVIVLNRSIMNDRQDILYTLAHEVGHAKDRSQTKFWQTLASYYASAAIVSNGFAFGITKHLTIKKLSKAALHTACSIAGIAGALCYHQEVEQIITEQLEKRADRIGLDYLMAQHKEEFNCNKKYLEDKC